MKKKNISRRKFIGTTVAATAVSLFPINNFCTVGISTKKPNSKVAGVQLGCTTYSYRLMPHKVDDVIQYLLLAGINSIELRSVAEEDLGIPQSPPSPPRGTVLTEEEKAERAEAISATREEQRQWRLSLPMQRYEEMRKKFNDAGIGVHIAKFAPSTWSDEEIDYAFKAAKVLGAYGITDELSDRNCQRLGIFAEKHKSLAIFHTHSQFAESGFNIDKYLAYSPANRLNLDVGHYYGSTGLHPNSIIEKYHNQIPSIHMKDKTGPNDDPPNREVPFGQGGVPIADILLLLKKERWPINVDVEMEYRPPEGSDDAKEVAKCIEYMRNILE